MDLLATPAFDLYAARDAAKKKIAADAAALAGGRARGLGAGFLIEIQFQQGDATNALIESQSQ
ncbi:MAG: hypothetical protein HY923_03455 [Elusimicrobia bacterium]|nr:hypothetical protein [Elusimicrobiota bacterium]